MRGYVVIMAVLLGLAVSTAYAVIDRTSDLNFPKFEILDEDTIEVGDRSSNGNCSVRVGFRSATSTLPHSDTLKGMAFAISCTKFEEFRDLINEFVIPWQ